MAASPVQKENDNEGSDTPTQYVVVVDTEYTSWEGCNENGWDAGRGQFREIIQIGALLIDCEQYVVVDEFETFVQPKKNTQLSAYIKELTGISQDDVDSAPTFSEAYQSFANFVGDTMIYSYGNEWDVFAENVELNSCNQYLSRMQFEDVRPQFEIVGVPVTQYESGTVCEYFAVRPDIDREQHDAIYDSYSLFIAMKELISSNLYR